MTKELKEALISLLIASNSYATAVKNFADHAGEYKIDRSLEDVDFYCKALDASQKCYQQAQKNFEAAAEKGMKPIRKAMMNARFRALMNAVMEQEEEDGELD